MEGRRLDFGQLYGYTVCLVAVLTFLFGAVQAVGAMLDIRELPYTASYVNGPSLVSLGAYKIDLLSRIGADDAGEAAESLVPPDSTLQRMLEAERLHRLALSHQTSRRSLVINLVLLSLTVILFTAHAMWLRARGRTDPVEAEPQGGPELERT